MTIKWMVRLYPLFLVLVALGTITFMNWTFGNETLVITVVKEFRWLVKLMHRIY